MGILSATGANGVEAPAFSDSGDGGDSGGDPQSGDESGQDTSNGHESEPQVPSLESSDNGQTRGSRRNRTAEAIDRHFSQMREELAKNREADAQRIAMLEQQNARLLGQFEQFQRVPQQPQQRQVPQDDPSELRRKADEALDAGKYAEHRRLDQMANRIEFEQIAEAKAQARFEELQRQMPQQVDPFIGALLGQHRNVAMAGERGTAAVRVKLEELKLMGAQPGQQTMAQAFELADKWLASMNKPQPRAQFTASAGAVAGLPTARGSNGAPTGDEPQLTDAQKRAAAAMGWTVQEYVKWQNPTAHGIKKW